MGDAEGVESCRKRFAPRREDDSCVDGQIAQGAAELGGERLGAAQLPAPENRRYADQADPLMIRSASTQKSAWSIEASLARSRNSSSSCRAFRSARGHGSVARRRVA